MYTIYILFCLIKASVLLHNTHINILITNDTSLFISISKQPKIALYAIHSYVPHHDSYAARPHFQYKYRYITLQITADKEIEQISNFVTKLNILLIVIPQEEKFTVE